MVSRLRSLLQASQGRQSFRAGQRRNNVKQTSWNTRIIIIGWAILTLIGISLLRRGNAFQDEYSFSLWYVFLPLIIIALFYFFSVVCPRKVREQGSVLNCRPVFWHSFSILGSLSFGILMTVAIQGTLEASMDLFNKDSIQVESVIWGITRSKQCKIGVNVGQKRSLCIEFIGHDPMRTPWNFNIMTANQINGLIGREVILIGRKSFMGTVIDEIRRSHDQD